MTMYPYFTIDTSAFGLYSRHEGEAYLSTASSRTMKKSKSAVPLWGGAIFANFFVTPPRQRQLGLVGDASNLSENRNLQLGKRGT